jgi:hypothetical protein
LLNSNMANVISLISSRMLGLHQSINHTQQSLNRLGMFNVATALGIGAAIAGFEKLIEHTKDLSHELVQIEKLGINAAQFAEVRTAAKAVISNIPGVSEKEALEGYGAAYSLFGHEGALKMLEPLEKFAQVMGNTTGRFETSIGDLVKMLRSADLMGAFTDPTTHGVDLDRLQHYLDIGSKAMLATHGIVTPQTMLGMAQQGGPALMNLDDHGLMTMLMMSQMMGGPRAGTAIMSEWQQMAGGVMYARVAKEMERIGLLAPGEWTTTKGGGVHLEEVASKRLTAQMGKDPLAFIGDTLLPAMKSHGITEAEDQIREVFKLFGRQTVERLNADMIRNFQQMIQERGRIEGALGIDAARDLANSKDVEQALHNVSAAWRNFEYALAGPGSENIVTMLNTVTGGINSMRDAVNAYLEAQARFDAAIGGLASTIKSFIGGFTAPTNPPGWQPGAAPPGVHHGPGGEFKKNSWIPPAGGDIHVTVKGDTVMDGRVVGELVMRQIGDRSTRPLEGSAHFDSTWSSPASDVSYA